VEQAKRAGKTGGAPSTDKRAFSLDTQHGLDSLESLALEQKLKPHQLTTEWLVSSIVKKSGASAKTVRSLLQRHANALSTLMALSRQVNWVKTGLYSDLLLASKEVPSGDGNGEGSSHALKVKKNGGSGKGEVATTINPSPFADAVDGASDMEYNDMEQGTNLLSLPEHSQPPKSSKGKSALRPIMTSPQRESREENVSSPLSSPPPSSTPVTVEQLVAPGPSTLPKRRQTSGAENSQEPAKRSRVSKGSASKGTSGGDDREDDWPPLIPGGGRPPIVVSKRIGMKPVDNGNFWRCSECLAIIPEAQTPTGRALIGEHANTHYLKVQRANDALEEEPEAKSRSLEFVPPKHPLPCFVLRRADQIRSALLDKIERMARAWQNVRREQSGEFGEIHAAMLQGERERGEVFLAPSTPKEDLDKSNGKGKGKGRQ